MKWRVYLSGEIHTDWREQIAQGCAERNLPITLLGPVTDHAASDAAGDGLVATDGGFWRDQQSARVNQIRTRTLIEKSDLVVVRFGEQYRQWNAAFDAGLCAALGKPYITLHDESLVHPLKEVDAAAQAWAQTPQQVVQLLAYTCSSACAD
ncbi:YtoQ family protein [Ferrimonas gelatinilytica]|uniref:YtoQ family protein n=1 Tax=Ferrimonas gelatinilytica TaxID=1255257 RepID=A0ABP9S8Z8_9GAMM